ncbi:MAG: hybrid sensor histidine kinase/response regulator [Actinomycetia bacterium]|nr:hybrid sensor histidine kinase/response regulator [Actinomycetes bacterium]
MVLVVDPDPEACAGTALALREGGFYVLEASSGPAALDQLVADAADTALLVTATVMPDMSGRDLAREVHSLRPAVSVLLIAGPGDERADRTGHDPRYVQSLVEPFGSDELVQAARRSLAPVTAA